MGDCGAVSPVSTGCFFENIGFLVFLLILALLGIAFIEHGHVM
ncbi:MAG: hypothetical protein ACM3RP_13275 [Chitinophagales bacterium]